MSRVLLPVQRMCVILESPFAQGSYRAILGDVRDRRHSSAKENLDYAKECLSDSLSRGESPIAFHLLYTQVLNDDYPLQRALGLEASAEWYKKANAVVVYTDLGISPGMEKGISIAEHLSLFIEYRKIRSTE